MNANIIPNLADIVSMFFSAEVLVPATIVSCFLGLCAALLRVNRDGDAMEAFIKAAATSSTSRLRGVRKEAQANRKHFDSVGNARACVHVCSVSDFLYGLVRISTIRKQKRPIP